MKQDTKHLLWLMAWTAFCVCGVLGVNSCGKAAPETAPATAQVAPSSDSSASAPPAIPPPPPGLVPGVKVTQTVTTTTKGGEVVESAKNVGSHIKLNGTDIKAEALNVAPGQASLTPAPNASGGGFTGSLSAAFRSLVWLAWLIGIVGGLLIFAGCAALYLGQPLKASIGTIVGGSALVGCAIFPEFAQFIALGAIVYAVVSLWLTGFDAAKFRDAATSMTRAIDAHVRRNPTTTLLAEVKAATLPAQRDTIKRIKKKHELTAEPVASVPKDTQGGGAG